MLGLVIETSCDETSAAIIRDGRNILSNIVATQIDIHKEFGGVVPEIASREHTKCIAQVVHQALEAASVTVGQLTYIGVTAGPGLVGALLVGVSYAKALAYTLNIPIVPVHHIEGHIAANYISSKELVPPFLALVVSGGHSHIIHVKDYTDFELVAKTRDDACGEAFDKVARVLGLGYPGGPKVSDLALQGSASYSLPVTRFEDNLDFSFSGIKTAVINLAHKEGENLRKADLACSFEKNVCETLVLHTIQAAEEMKIDKIVVAGGVSANRYLREHLKKECEKHHKQCYIPKIEYCTDNAAMVASAAYYSYIANKEKYDILNQLTLNAKANLKIGGM